jgi:DNA repair and recombination protein RAD52
VIGYRAIVTVTVYDVHHKFSITREDVGYGTGIARDYASAHESAGKEATTDALKRAFRTFGNQFGNALYDKTQKNVDRPNQQQAPQQIQQSQVPQQSSSDPYASLYQLGLGIQEANGEIVVTGQTYGKQEHIKKLGFRWDGSRKVWYKQNEYQEAA